MSQIIGESVSNWQDCVLSKRNPMPLPAPMPAKCCYLETWTERSKAPEHPETFSFFLLTVPTLHLIFFLFFFLMMFWVFLINLFIYFWLCWVFVSAQGLSLIVASGGRSSSRCTVLSLSRPLLLRSTGYRRAGSVVVAHGPSCSAACGIFPEIGRASCRERV